jgi:hypothetical protein
VPNLVPIVALALLTLGAVPRWPWSRGWGWAPSGVLGLGLAPLVLFQLSVGPAA